MKISIVTATYNRAKLLPNLYKSICESIKKYKDIEWLIMDDGSKDDTKNIIKNWVKESKFEIKYFYQHNSGKQVALNNLISKTKGELIIEMDDDDYFRDDAFFTISKDYESIKDKDNIYALLYLKTFKGKENYNKFPYEKKIITLFDLYYKYDYKVDTAIVFIADKRKKFKYKIEKDEKFITEARMYHEMDKKYGIYPVNKDIMICEYMNEGYSKNINKIFINNPYGYYEYFKELLNFRNKDILFKKRIYMLKHFILFSTLTKRKYKESYKNINCRLNKLLFFISYLMGKIMTKLKIK